jgi:hypothetical protein
VVVKKKKARSTKSARRTGGKSKAPARKARARRGASSRGKKAVRRNAGKKTRKPKRSAKVSAPARSSARPRARAEETWARGLGPESGGQSGDTEQISRTEIADSESVEELLEEGQAFEAGVVSGVENAPDADEGEVRTREVPEDDVPEEYLGED